MIATHHGNWTGVNRLWLEGPTSESSPGTAEVEATQIRYTWVFRDKPQTGVLVISGTAGALRADWEDSMHYSDGTVLHGLLDDGVLKLYGTYPAGDGPDWGWRIQVDFRDPETFILQMYNVQPGEDPVIAVDLRAQR